MVNLVYLFTSFFAHSVQPHKRRSETDQFKIIEHRRDRMHLQLYKNYEHLFYCSRLGQCQILKLDLIIMQLTFQQLIKEETEIYICHIRSSQSDEMHVYVLWSSQSSLTRTYLPTIPTIPFLTASCNRKKYSVLLHAGLQNVYLL